MCFAALLHHRPWRPRRSPAEALAVLTEEAEAGRLDAPSVRALGRSLGQPAHQARSEVALTRREEEVLGLLSSGRTNRAIADLLVISPKTVSRHLEATYRKLGVSTRAAATLIAVERGLHLLPVPGEDVQGR